MSDEFFAGTPDMSLDFANSSREVPEKPLEYDAQEWEPIEEHAEKHAEMHFTPGGALE